MNKALIIFGALAVSACTMGFETDMDKAKKPKNQLLWNMQQKLNELYYELINIISGKKGVKERPTTNTTHPIILYIFL